MAAASCSEFSALEGDSVHIAIVVGSYALGDGSQALFPEQPPYLEPLKVGSLGNLKFRAPKVRAAHDAKTPRRQSALEKCPDKDIRVSEIPYKNLGSNPLLGTTPREATTKQPSGKPNLKEAKT